MVIIGLLLHVAFLTAILLHFGWIILTIIGVSYFLLKQINNELIGIFPKMALELIYYGMGLYSLFFINPVLSVLTALTLMLFIGFSVGLEIQKQL